MRRWLARRWPAALAGMIVATLLGAWMRSRGVDRGSAALLVAGAAGVTAALVALVAFVTET